MSSIDKMLIKGIRSFSPNNDNVIEFYKPLTLIVGHNGAGKTTIIECLKMACTGELPPNTRNGQSFIHDPKVAGETEVKAQIKLRFEAQTGQSFIVVRSFQLTQKKAALQFKALDNILQTKDPATGQTVALPYRCADINAVVPAYMGVTKAVLENVIFVHQEDSNWPLAETQVLKKKFDDIFAATKYTKALEELRKLKTRQAQDAREMRLRLETLSTHRNQAARLRGDAAAGAARAAALEAEIGALTARAAALAAARAQIDAKLGSFADVSETLMALRARHDMLASKNAESLVRLEAAYGADSAELRMAAAELEALLANMAPFADDSSAQLARLEREESTARLRAEAVRDQREREGKAHGRLAAEADAHGRNVAERDAFLRRVCAEAGAPAPVGDDPSRPLDPAAAAAFKAAFRARLDAARAALDAARGGHQREDDDRAAALDAAAAEMSAATEGARMKQDQFRANQARIAELTAQLGGAAGGSREALDAARAREAALESRLAASEAELASSSAEEAGRQAAEGLAQLAPRAEALRAERAALAADAEEATRMNYKAQELADAEARQAGLLAQHRASLGMILDLPHTEVPPPGEALLAAAQKAAAARRGEAAQRAAAAAELRARASAAAGSLSAASAQLERAASELDGLAARLAAAPEAAGGTAVASHLAELEGRRREKQAEISSSDALLRIFNAQIRMAQTTGGCATCKRKFESPAAAEQFVASTRADIEAMPGRLGAIQSEVAQLEARLKELKVLEPVAMRHDALRDVEMPELQRRQAEAQAAAEAAEGAAAAAASQEQEAAAAAAEAQAAVAEGAAPLAALARDIAARRAQVETLRATMRVTSAARSVADADADLARIDAERAQLEAARAAASATVQRARDAVAALRTELHAARGEAMRLGAAAERRAAGEAQIAELAAANDALSSEVVEARRRAAPLEARRRELAAAREAARGAARAAEAALEAALRELQTHDTQLEARERALADYESRGGGAALAAACARLETLARQAGEADAACRAAREALQLKKAEAFDRDEVSRQLNDILSFRRSADQEAALAAEMDAKGAAAAALGDRAALAAEFARLEGEESGLRSEADRASGALGTVREAAGRAAAELGQPQYAGVEAKHRAAQVELRTTEMAAADLDKYHKALERALLSFHTTKMADINAAVKELWQKTYRNSDIDYIAIRADTEGGAARSYNYRVVMACGGAELDMRGRCSAGQKVLACLIIRLALAETFCLHCGILALDEPTTNLDADNAGSLAEALRAVMAARREQANFQLVVITHDEAFARHIGTREHAEHMWRITKDDAQHSTLMREEIMA